MVELTFDEREEWEGVFAQDEGITQQTHTNTSINVPSQPLLSSAAAVSISKQWTKETQGLFSSHRWPMGGSQRR